MLFIPVAVVQYIGVFFISCFGFGYLECVWVLYTNSVFDKYINAVNYPDFVRKGLYRGEDTEIEGVLDEEFNELYGEEEAEE